jgi:hypothetical protein
MFSKLIHRRWSTYLALGVWGATGFMAQPTLASLVVHMLVSPILLGATIFAAHYEGRHDNR